MKRILPFVLLFLLSSSYSFGQFLTFDFAGIVGDEVSVGSNFNDPNISPSTITRGSGLDPANNGSRFNSNNHTTSATVDLDHYVEFTITPNAQTNFSITSIEIKYARSGTGPGALALRSSADSYTADLGGSQTITDNTSSQTFTFTFSMSMMTTATTFRLYSYASESGTTGSGGPGDGSGNDISVFGMTVPVELTSFTTTKSKNAVELNWTTSSEINNDFFAVEYSKDGINFTELAKVEGNGTTNREMDYSYMHESPESAMNYYRLMQVDYDGAYEYSDVRSVSFDNKSNVEFKLYPTITDTEVTVQYEQGIENASLAIYNMQGQLVYNNTVVNGESIDIATLIVGTYTARLITDNRTQTVRFIKQ